MRLSDVTELEILGAVAVIRTTAPPVNALAADVRAGLCAALAAAEADPQVRAIVISCGGRTFHAGADIGELARGPASPLLPDVLAAFERSERLLVAALHGTPLGGGLELALTADVRVAEEGTRCGLPEVKLGLIPGAGGTQRLPRAIGVAAAVEIIVSGRQVAAQEALALGLIDQVVAKGTAESAAIAYATRCLADGTAKRRLSARTPPGDAAAIESFEQAAAARWGVLAAPRAAVRAVRSSLDRPFAEGLAAERAEFLALVRSEQSLALRHLFFAERAVARSKWLSADTAPQPVERVGVVGAGTMGGGIAMSFLNAGYSVCLVEQNAAALERGLGVIRRNYESSAAKGKLTVDAVEERLARLSSGVDLANLSACDLVIEAIYENMEAKVDLFARLDTVVKSTAILASNTSYLDISRMAAATARPERVCGLHFFSPAHVNRLLEIVRTDSASAETLATAQAVAKRIGKVGILVGNAYGFVGNRMLQPRQREADALILEGALPRDVDRVLESFGFPMGPFRMRDLAGMDIGWAREQSRSSTVREILCEMGRLGQKSGGGYYDYDASRRATPSLIADDVVRAFATRQGIAQRVVSDEEILERCLYPMVMEGLRILEEGIAERSSDIDMVWITGYGWPSHTGGPMYWGQTVGIEKIKARWEQYSTKGNDN